MVEYTTYSLELDSGETREVLTAQFDLMPLVTELEQLVQAILTNGDYDEATEAQLRKVLGICWKIWEEE